MSPEHLVEPEGKKVLRKKKDESKKHRRQLEIAPNGQPRKTLANKTNNGSTGT